ncbi:epithelial-stromal interaction protein 1 [Piliocolobus tephrosceles]|uniref:epithelial-stromal interaction protein 1 n=1 Tax=Piliocolobus tephrosceles TaxID=591936 RepID=UPI000E6B1314|nr:epithelial-stromal interaction protein 1 [Piliocolobus tephrosceles]
MYTRSRVVSSGLGASPASRPTQDPRDPYGRHGKLGRLEDQRQGLQAAPESPSRESVVHAGQRHTSAYTLIAPNVNRRNQIQRIAEQELANLEKWKEQNRAKPVHLVPRRLGKQAQPLPECGRVGPPMDPVSGLHMSVCECPL